MANPILKNIPPEQALDMAALIPYQQGQIVSRTLTQNQAVSVTLFAFEQEEEISTHESRGDALVQILDGTALVTVGGTEHTLRAGQCIVMPANVSHAVAAPQRFQMMLTVVFPSA